MAKGGMTKKSYKTQGYDDKEDERLAMKHGKMAGKDLKNTRARRDDARFEERMAKGGGVVSRYRLTFMNDDGEKKYQTTDAYNKADAMKVGKWWEKYPNFGNYKVVSVVELEELEDEDIQDKSYYKIRNDRRRKKERDLKSKEELMEFMTEKGIEKVTFKNNPVSVKPYKKGGKLSTKAKYIPKRDIEEVEVDQNGKEKMIDGADLLDGIYVKKASYKKKVEKKASGGQLKPKPKSKAKGTVGGGKLGNKGGNLANVVKLAKEMRKDGEKWTDAVKRASAQLKKDK
jgi:hypothetical protein